MFVNFFTFLTISLYDFIAASIESVLVFLVFNIVYKNYNLQKNAMIDAVDESEDVEEPEDTLSLPLPELAEMSDSFLLSDGDKTKRIKELEEEVRSLTQQLIDARNLANNLYTEIDSYKRVNGQVGWLIEQFRQTISGSDIRKPRPQLPPPPLSPVTLPLPEVEGPGDESYLTESNTEEADVEDEYSEDWETTEETENQTHNIHILFDGEISDTQDPCVPFIGPLAPGDIMNPQNFTTEYHSLRDETPISRAPRDPTPIPRPPVSDPEAELDALLAVATPQTRISEIFRRWFPFTGPSPT